MAAQTFEAVVVEQKLTKAVKSGGYPILNLVVEVLGEYKNPYDHSFGIRKLDNPEREQVAMFFNPSNGLEDTVKQMALFGIDPAKFQLADLHPSSANHINLKGQKIPVYKKVRDDGTIKWYVSKYANKPKQDGTGEGFSVEDLKSVDSENKDIYERLRFPVEVPF